MFGRIVDGLNGLGSILIFAIMLLICLDVIGRDAFNRPIYGVSELVAMSIVAIVFLQLPSTLRHGRMARADIFIDGFVERRPRAGHGLQALFHGLGAILCGVIIHATWPVFAKAWGNEEFIGVEGVFTAPTWPLRLIVLIGAAFTALQYLALAAQHLGEAHAAGKPAP